MEDRKHRWGLFFILAGTFLVPVNSTMIAVGLPVIAEALQATVTQASWMVTVYLIVMTVTQSMAGKLGDIYGNRRIFLLGIFLFLVSSLLCLFPGHLIWLIFFRALQAVGAALAAPNASAILRYVIPKEQLPQTFGIFGFSMGIGAAIGPLAGALLITWWGWTSIFWVNIPFCILSLIGCFLLLPHIEKQAQAQLDVWGSLFLGVSLTTLVFLVTHPGFVKIWTVTLLIISVLLFIRQERKCQEPLVDFTLFRDTMFTCANLSILLSNAVMYSTILVMPLMLETSFGYSITDIGALLFGFSLAMSMAAWLGGQLLERLGTRKIVLLSFFLSGAALGGYASFFYFHPLFYVAVVLVIGGAGAGMGGAAMQNASLQSVPRSMSGIASGIYSTFRYIGGMIASILVGLMLGFHWLVGILLVFTLGGMLVSARMVPSASRRNSTDMQADGRVG